MQTQAAQPGGYPYAMQQNQQPQFYTLMSPSGVPTAIAPAGYVAGSFAPGTTFTAQGQPMPAIAGQPRMVMTPQMSAAYSGGPSMASDGNGSAEIVGGYQEMTRAPQIQGQPYQGPQGAIIMAPGRPQTYAMVPRGGPGMPQPRFVPAGIMASYGGPTAVTGGPAVYSQGPAGYVYAPMQPVSMRSKGGMGIPSRAGPAGYQPAYNMNYAYMASPQLSHSNSDLLDQQQLNDEEDDAPITNIYIRGLGNSVTDDQLHDMCTGFGTIISSKAIIDIRTNECKGYGFVMYETQEQAKVAMTDLIKQGFQVSFAKESFSARLKNLQDSGSTNIYMSNIPMNYTEEGLTELFAPLNVLSQKILRDSSGVSRGVGFIRFDTREDAVAAIDKFHGITLPGGTAPLQVRFSDSPAQKKLKIAVANKRKVMKTGPMPFGIRRRSEIDEQYMYAAAPDYYDMSGAMPSYAPLPMAMPDMAGAGGQMPAVYWQQGMPMMAQMPGMAPVRTSPNEDRSASRTPPEVDLLRVNSQGMLSVPRSPSDLGQSAEISAASDFESTGDMDELTARVKELMYEGGASDEGADETVVTRGNGLDGELLESDGSVESKPAQ